jgi:23S rRNA (adenine2503-C2)-methyltransferase
VSASLAPLAPLAPIIPIEPWSRRAPEKDGLPAAWSLLPEDLAVQGCPGRPEHVFARLQRPLTWLPERPNVSREIRSWLESHTDLALPAIAERHASDDGSVKLVLEMSDGQRVEAVHMPRKDGDRRVTCCISSQVGCALGCTFCATGAMGIVRNLTAGEIVAQVITLMRTLGPRCGEHLYLVFMGMGEPLHNLDHVHRAITVLCREGGAGLSPRRITVSTAGLVPGIERLGALKPRPNLAVSLNATTDAARSATMPINRAFNLARLRQAVGAWPLERNERFLFEYVLLAGVNDTLDDADRLVDWLGDLRHRHNVNLIPMNEHVHSTFREPAHASLEAFALRLRQGGCFVTVRRSRGRDVQAACGQLVAVGE